MSIDAVERGDLIALVAKACERHVTVQLSFCAPDGNLESTQIRLVESGDGVIYVDEPEGPDTQLTLKPNQALLGFFELDGRQYEFVSRVRRCPAPAGFPRCNSQTRLAMDLPAGMMEVENQRCDYRVTVVGRHTIPVILVEADPLDVGACPVGARRYRTRLADISAGGVSVVGDNSALGAVNAGDRYYASFRLSDAQSGLDLLVQVRHVYRVPQRNVCRVGCVIECWPGSNLHHDAQYIMQFVMQEQFKVARHQRG